MNIFLICSKAFYDHIPPIQRRLEACGFLVTVPNCYDDPGTEDRMREQGWREHATWKARMFRDSEATIALQDAVLVLNYEKNSIPNYIGGATFLEMYEAIRSGKRIYILNDIPSGTLRDEIIGFSPICLKGDITAITTQ